MIEPALNTSAGENELPLESAHIASASTNEWAQLTRAIAHNGDRSAFKRYYEDFFDTMFLTAKQATDFDEATCLDIVQDAMVKVISKMKVMHSRDQVTAWTKVVAKTTAYDFLRKQARQRKHNEQLLNMPQADEAESSAPESVARMRWIEEQLQQLPGELSSMVSMKYRMGWTLRQIGEKFGLKTGAVDGRIRRAIEDLKTKAIKEFENE